MLPGFFLLQCSLVRSGVCFVIMMIMYSFEKMLSENANFRINNVNNAISQLMEYGITHMPSRQNGFKKC